MSKPAFLSHRTLFALAATTAVLAFALAFRSTNAGEGGAKAEPASNSVITKSAAPKYWKGNLHTHSLWSDGDDFPEMIADWYKSHGYHFLTLSDHNVLSEGARWIATAKREKALKKYRERFGDVWVEQRTKGDKDEVRLKPLAEVQSVLEEPGRFLMIPGEEVTHKYGKNPVHINAINLRDVIKPIDGKDVAETIRVNLRLIEAQAKKTGWATLAFLNHPNFNWGVRAEDMIAAEELQFFEIQNGHPTVYNMGDEKRAGTEKMWDIANAVRIAKHRLPPLLGVATDDAHAYHEFTVKKANAGRSWIMVRSPFLSPEAIVRAMFVGDFYCSSGVTLRDVRREGKTIRVAIEPKAGVKYRTQFVITPKTASLDSRPVLDKDGKEMFATGQYSGDVGKVVNESTDLESSYTMTGDELYVRVRVVSDRRPQNPGDSRDLESAWTQPFVP